MFTFNEAHNVVEIKPHLLIIKMFYYNISSLWLNTFYHFMLVTIRHQTSKLQIVKFKMLKVTLIQH